eukprot:gene12022-biopygen5041
MIPTVPLADRWNMVHRTGCREHIVCMGGKKPLAFAEAKTAKPTAAGSCDADVWMLVNAICVRAGQGLEIVKS